MCKAMTICSIWLAVGLIGLKDKKGDAVAFVSIIALFATLIVVALF